jgi:ATP-dependent exoDNAse (exonuclease V) beta subunit|tara:strand:- start:3871 stop:4548 length:678 start_codon:yes stop_codon:yes gene_type:complete
MFNHVPAILSPLERETIDGVRFYKVPDQDEFLKLVSITSVTSFWSRAKFAKWRKKVGEEKANEITRKATARGTDMHTLTEHYLLNAELPKVAPMGDMLFKIAKPTLNNIDNIHALEGSLYSKELGVAGTVDCIAEYNGELSIIDFKTSKAPKPREWIDGYFVQAAAYACMYYELTGIAVKKLVIIMACEDGDCVVYEEYDKMKYMRLLVTYIENFLTNQLQLHGQ